VILWCLGSREVWQIQLQVTRSTDDADAMNLKKSAQDDSNIIAVAVSICNPVLVRLIAKTTRAQSSLRSRSRHFRWIILARHTGSRGRSSPSVCCQPSWQSTTPRERPHSRTLFTGRAGEDVDPRQKSSQCHSTSSRSEALTAPRLTFRCRRFDRFSPEHAPVHLFKLVACEIRRVSGVHLDSEPRPGCWNSWKSCCVYHIYRRTRLLLRSVWTFRRRSG
jgi:hypothetical protein